MNVQESEKLERKVAKQNYKNSLKGNPVKHQEERESLINYLIKQAIPNWNVKFELLYK